MTGCAVRVRRLRVEPLRGDVVADTTLRVLLFFVGVVAVHARGIFVSIGGERDAHGVTGLVTIQAVAPLGDEFLLRNSELVAYDTVNVHILGRLQRRVIMALHTGLLGRFEDMQLNAVTVDAIRGLVHAEKVYLVARRVHDL